MFDNITRFLDATEEWGKYILDGPKGANLNSLPGKPETCFIFSRHCNIDEMECEDDEKYVFSTVDRKVHTTFNRFQARIILSQLGEQFNPERIESIIKMAWNYPELAIDRVTAAFEPYHDPSASSVPPLPSTGGPPRKVVYMNE